MTSYVEAHPIATITTGVLALVLLALVLLALRAAIRATTRAARALTTAVRGWAATRPTEDVLTIVAASIATGVSAQGMWRFAGDVLGLDGPLRLLLFAFIEVAVITSAVRARRKMRENYSAGIDGLAVWVFTCLSAVLSSMDARSVAEAVFRLAAPLVAAWLWERGMAIERRRIRGRSAIHWRITPERVLVRLGLAEATDRTAEEVDVQRRLDRVALAADNAYQLREAGASQRRQRRAYARLRRAFRAAAHTGLARDPEQQEVLLRAVGVLRSLEQLLDVPPASAWASVAESEPAGQGDFARLAEETRQLRESLTDRADQHDRKSDLANVTMLLADLARQRPASVTPCVTTPGVANGVTAEVAEPPLFLPREWMHRPSPATSDVTPLATGPAVAATVTTGITSRAVIDVFDPAAFDLPWPPPVTVDAADDVTLPATTTEVTGEADDQAKHLSDGSPDGDHGDGDAEPETQSKTKIMRDLWDRELAEGRYPSVRELADAAGAHHSLASRNRRAWVNELPWWQRRKATKPRREKVTS